MAKVKAESVKRFWVVNAGGVLHETTREQALALLKGEAGSGGGPYRMATAAEIAELEARNGFQSAPLGELVALPYDPEHGGWVRDSSFDEKP